jgi:light-harvesting protein B-800-850 alpha chain
MNQARIWLVVNPTVGLPLLLGSVTGIALLVHYSVLSHTTWFEGYWQGGKNAKAAAETSGLPQVGEFVLPNGAKVKFSFEDAAPQQPITSTPTEVLAANVALEDSARSPVSKPPPLGAVDSVETAAPIAK